METKLDLVGETKYKSACCQLCKPLLIHSSEFLELQQADIVTFYIKEKTINFDGETRTYNSQAF